ncbi:HAMP domain-containing histidine kinase [Phormidium tenue FACHB-886]|nr:HAMP domain-containing histidine kinase [Phormidium tenue FACHB-886]
MPVKPSDFDSRSLKSENLTQFCQRRADHLTTHSSIALVRIVYQDPSTQHKAVWSRKEDCLLVPELLHYLTSETWLCDFPPVLSLSRVPLDSTQYHGYLCPIGYRNQQPEYLFVLSKQRLASDQQNYLIETATCLIEYLELYRNTYQKQSEIHLLEHIIHRIGHQLRNPLGLIALYAETLRQTSTTQTVQQQAGVIWDTVQHLLTNLTDLIYCGQSDRLNTSLQDLQVLVSESVAAFQPFIEQKQITVSYPNTSVLLQVDRLQIKQVLDNLLSNAIHFSPINGAITLNWWSFQGEVLIQISDQGSGISADALQKIFNPFYTRRPGGTGLGLTIAKKIVLDHQGNLWAQSLPEGGAQFSITLPRPLIK